MDKFIEGLATVVGTLLAIAVVVGGFGAIVVLAALLHPLIGALAGAIVGWAFPVTSTVFLAAIGMGGLKLWQLGVMLAFVGRFFRTNKAKSPAFANLLPSKEKFWAWQLALKAKHGLA